MIAEEKMKQLKEMEGKLLQQGPSNKTNDNVRINRPVYDKGTSFFRR